MIERRMRIGILPALSVLVALLAAGCGGEELIQVPPQNPPHIAVRYLLVGFADSPPSVANPRSAGAADSLADSLFAAARAGADFGSMIGTWSDSPSQDTLAIANYGVTPGPGEYRRDMLVRGFADAAFVLEPDSIGLAEYDSITCPTGWFLVQRVD